MASSRLPAFAMFPLEEWRTGLGPQEWSGCLDAWVALIASHLSLSDSDFLSISAKDESLTTFLTSFIKQTALEGTRILGPSQSAKRLVKDSFLLITRLLQSSSPPLELTEWEFLGDLSRVYGRKKTAELLSTLSEPSRAWRDASLAGLKKFLIKNMDAGLQGGDLKAVESRLDGLNGLIDASPDVAFFFLMGSDFLDALIKCYKIMNPPLRKVIIATTYLCFIGMAEGQKISSLTDQLYSLKAAADAHKVGPLNVNDSLVAELVTSTPFIQQLERRIALSDYTTSRTTSALKDLAAFKKAGGGITRPKRLAKRKVDKGKALEEFDDTHLQQEMHIHRMSQISQIQDLFPDIGSGFASKLLDEYNDNNEQVIAHLLEDSLPPHLRDADRSEELAPQAVSRPHHELAPRSTPPPQSDLPARRNVFDDDDFDRLVVNTSNLQLGKRTDIDADTILADRSKAPNKAAILSALAAFDSDDDERDDTYDADDVGGTVDVMNPEADTVIAEGTEAKLYEAYSATPKLFDRDNAVRRGIERVRLRHETGMTDEAIEGWALMLERNPGQKKRLQARYGDWTGRQTEIASTAWRAGIDDGDDDEEEGRGSSRGGRGGGRGRGRGRGGGSGGPPGSELEKRRKEANKASRANHNRREGHAKKMARGGAFPG
ncbi:putative cue domain containing protein [Naviculisporaceae sp. PSN 640]